MRKTWGWALLIATSLFGMTGGTAFGAGADARIVLQLDNHNAEVNGEVRTLDVAPTILDGRTMVPLRFVSEALGAHLDFAEAEQKITLTLGSDTLVLWIQKQEALVNGEAVQLDVAPQVMHDRTLVPVRFVSEKLKKHVEFNEAIGVITITENADSVSQEQPVVKTNPIAGNTYRLYMNQNLDVGTLKISSDGTYLWDGPFTEKPYAGKWTEAENSIELHDFGMGLDQTYALSIENGNVFVRDANGDEFQAEKL